MPASHAAFSSQSAVLLSNITLGVRELDWQSSLLGIKTYSDTAQDDAALDMNILHPLNNVP